MNSSTNNSVKSSLPNAKGTVRMGDRLLTREAIYQLYQAAQQAHESSVDQAIKNRLHRELSEYEFALGLEEGAWKKKLTLLEED